MKSILILGVFLAFGLFNQQINLLQHVVESKIISVDNQDKKCEFSFSSSVKYGKQAHQLSVLLSTDFDGNYNLESINKATWKSLNQVAKIAKGEEFESSGAIDLTQFLEKGKPFYIAFKYVGDASTNGKPTQRTWQLKDLKLNEAALTQFNIVNNSNNGPRVGWYPINKGLIFRPNATLMVSEGWAISNQLSQ